MCRHFAFAAIIALPDIAPIHAQTSAPDTGAKPGRHAIVGDPLAAGANSFTETQVRERCARVRFGDVRDLAKVETGIWRGTAIHPGQDARIGKDFKGTVAAQSRPGSTAVGA